MRAFLIPALLLSIVNPDGRSNEDPVDVIFALTLDNGKVTPRDRIVRIRRSRAPFDRTKEQGPEEVAPSKIHPLLEKWLSARDASAVEPLVITFRDELKIPRFPEPAIGEPRESAMNKRILVRNEALVHDIRRKRRGGYARMAKKLEGLGVRFTEEFWLVHAVRADTPLGAVRLLAAMQDVLYVEPVHTENPPPQNEVDDGRASMNSDPYFNLGQTGGFIGLLDTGVRAQHVLFQSPSHLGVRRDCVNGTTFCLGGSNAADDCWNHGTASAGILTANAAQGAAFRGVTAITVDSFKVYPSTFDGPICTGALDTAAALRGFQGAVAMGDRVIVASIQGYGSHASSISLAADAAFDAGAVVVAANGNFGPLPATVNSPANAHRVLGVGSFDVRTLTQENGQSRGPTSDGRTKPDIQAPTNSETASTGCPFRIRCTQSNTARQNFNGTSGAVPYAGGAAALVRNFLRGGTGVIEPGYVYAYLINAGQHQLNDISGVGPIRLPVNAEVYFGKVAVNDGQTLDIPLLVRGTPATLDAALWWPEAYGLPHNDVDLELIHPNGTIAARSLAAKSVFERARAILPAPGNWIVRIRGFKVLIPQNVYLALAIQ